MITFSEIQLLRGGKPLLEQASATIHPGDKVGLVGKNGCGKSTLFALLKDELTIDAGSFSKPAHWELAWVAQETRRWIAQHWNTLSMAIANIANLSAN